MADNFQEYISFLDEVDTVRVNGRVKKVIGLIIESSGPEADLGEICNIYTRERDTYIPAEVVGFRDNKVLLMPLDNTEGIGPGCEVVATRKPYTIPVGKKLLGRVLNGLGHPIDGLGMLPSSEVQGYPIRGSAPDPLSRKRISTPLSLGIKSIDGLLTCGMGQRIGIFAGSGVGKSVLLSMIAKNTEADINVIALIGERGREVRAFLDNGLDSKALKKTVVVAATSDQPALVRIKGAMTATTVAEYFRDQGNNVLLLMDSVTRYAMAQREVGLAAGEPPTTKGYTPSVFAELPRLLERAGTSESGSITGLYTVLVEGDDMEDPVADAVRSILDGHIVLSRHLASRDHYPAVDILQSVSRLMTEIVDDKHIKAARKLRQILSVYEEAEDLINIGAYEKGSNSEIDEAVEKIKSINSFLKQDINESYNFGETKNKLISLLN